MTIKALARLKELAGATDLVTVRFLKAVGLEGVIPFKDTSGKATGAFLSATPPTLSVNRLVAALKTKQLYKTVTRDGDGYTINLSGNEGWITISEVDGKSKIEAGQKV